MIGEAYREAIPASLLEPAEKQGRPTWFQINSIPFLRRLGDELGIPHCTVKDIPDSMLKYWQTLGLTPYFLGVYERGKMVREHALQWKHQYIGALPDMTDDDVIGSAFARASDGLDYRVAGSQQEWLAFKRRVNGLGMRLIGDDIPNHVGLDYPRLTSNPGWYMQGRPEELQRQPSDFVEVVFDDGSRGIFAHGKEPHFLPWADTVQVFPPGLSPVYERGSYQQKRGLDAFIESTVKRSRLFDGFRCDMAPLMLSDVYTNTEQWVTWGRRISEEDRHWMRNHEYWKNVIDAVRKNNPDFLFIAEGYSWQDTNTHDPYLFRQLAAQGFDGVYDKETYEICGQIADGESAEHLAQRMQAQYDANLPYDIVQFPENHDEPRARETMGRSLAQVAAVAMAFNPHSIFMIQDGFMEGAQVRLPIQLGRAPVEPIDTDNRVLIERVLQLKESEFFQGAWEYRPEYQNGIVIERFTYGGIRADVCNNFSYWDQVCILDLRSASDIDVYDVMGDRWISRHEQCQDKANFKIIPRGHSTQVVFSRVA